MRERYEALMAKPQEIEDILQVGANKARQYAAPFIKEIREAVGLRNTAITISTHKETSKKAKSARFVSFRDSEGQFMFRLLAANGQEILVSRAFANPKEAGMSSKGIVTIDMTHDIQVRADEGFDVLLNGEVVASSVNATNPENRAHILALLEESLNQLKAE